MELFQCYSLIFLLYFSIGAAVGQQARYNPNVNTWRKATVYEIMTDRFNNPQNTLDCLNPDQYCGGTFKGVHDKLGYLSKLNMKSVWLTPSFSNTPDGYHGYWVQNMYKVNPYFGTEDDLIDLLNGLYGSGLYSMLDVVLNHMGYGTTYPSFCYFFNPFNQPYQFHSCDQCGEGCSAPSTVPENPNSTYYDLMWTCRLSELPDVNHSQSEVVDLYLDWADYLTATFPFQGLRYDAIPYIEPEFLAAFAERAKVFGLGEILLSGPPNGLYSVIEMYLMYGKTMEHDALKENPEGGFSQLDSVMAFALRRCFAGSVTEGDGCGQDQAVGCRCISYVRGNYTLRGMNQKLMGRYLESADIPRFLTLYNNTVSLQSALAALLLGEGIPILWQGTEQGVTDVGKYGEIYENGSVPLWIVTDFGTGGNLFVYIRMLNYYRTFLKIYDQEFVELWSDQNTFGFSVGSLFAILPNGNATVLEYALSNLTPSKTYCQLQVTPDASNSPCMTTDDQGQASIPGYAPGEVQFPLIFVYREDARPYQQFLPYQHWPVEWVEGLIVSLLLLPVSMLCGRLIVRFSPQTVSDRITNSTKRMLQNLGILKRKMKNLTLVFGQVEMFSRDDDEKNWKASGFEFKSERHFISSSHSFSSPLISEPGFLVSLLHHNATDNVIKRYASAFRKDPLMVWHIALEYAVPHLGFHNELRFGGLGQIVGMFADYNDRPLVVCAPMYRPFYDEQGNLTAQHDLEYVTSLPIKIDDNVATVNIHMTASNDEDSKVFYVLLDCYDIFGWRNKGDIYSFNSERDQLEYFSVYCQTLATLVGMFGVQCVQLHDNHSGLFLEYIKPSLRPRVLVTLHNADYNTKFKLGTRTRNEYIYSILNLTMDRMTRQSCEHSGYFDFLYILVRHVAELQNGNGFVAVSPRYAERCYVKFSRFWKLPQAKVIGILNGFEDKDRVFTGPADFKSLFESKVNAKEQLQARLGLQVGSEKKMLTFFGRVTHQKGCDLIALAAPGILNHDPSVQIVIAGPIGDAYGVKTLALMEKLQDSYPGRVANLVGQYVSGAEKTELILGTDFFFCPSRFEPCGLADIEMGHFGAIQVGHNTGGLNKMPGFYFEADLDNDSILVKELERACLKAISEEPLKLQALAEEAMQKSFPPHVMVTAYEDEWKTLNTDFHSLINKVKSASQARTDSSDEAKFYETVWQIENSVDDQGKENESWDLVRAFWSNILLIICQYIYRLPSLVCFIWVMYVTTAGDSSGLILNDSYLMPTFVQLFFIQLLITFIAAPLWQCIASVMSPRHYILLASWLNIVSWYCALWSLWAPSSTGPLFIISSVLGTSPVPFVGFINMDVENKISIASEGVKLMGLSDCFWYLLLAIVYSQNRAGQYVNRTNLIIVGCIFLALSAWLTEFFAHKKTLPPHFRHNRLNYRGQFKVMFQQRKTWMYFSLIAFLDSFMMTLILGCILEYLGSTPSYVTGAFVSLVGTTALYSVLAAWMICSPVGGILSVKLYYAMACFPLMALAQALIVVYCPSWATFIATTVVNVFSPRYNLIGLLNLHTIPSREMFLSVTTLQVMFGSIAVGLATLANWKLQFNDQWLWITLMAIAEGLRLVLCVPFVKSHKKENLARP